MRALVQRVAHAKCTVDGKVTGEIQRGIVVLLGVTHSDTKEDAEYLADKCVNLRIFEDADGKMNLSLLDVRGALLAVSQFTLYGDTSHGRRPAFVDAARPEQANELYNHFIETLRHQDLRVETGIFRADMLVEIANDGPVTLMVESKAKK